MRTKHLDLMCCPKTGNALTLENPTFDGDRVRTGTLVDSSGQHRYPIVDFVPRFVPRQNYCDNFSVEWREHALTLHGTYSGHDFSGIRFRKETRWGDNLAGQTMLELGSGSGSFTTHALKTGATVVSFDFSLAVDSNQQINGAHPNLLLVQADIYNMPFRKGSFDFAFCFGVIQHTPDPKASLAAMVEMVKPGGKIASDVYAHSEADPMLVQKYRLRPYFVGADPEKLYKWVVLYVLAIWIPAWLISWIPRIGRQINRWLLIDHYFWGQCPNATQKYLREMNIAFIYDMLSPVYDFPQTLESYRAWHEELGLDEIDVCHGYNGIEGHATRSPHAKVGTVDPARRTEAA